MQMRVGMPVRGLPRVCMHLAPDLDRHHEQPPVPDTALCDHVVSEVLNLARTALEDCHLHAAIVIEMDMQGRHRHVVMLVRGMDQALGEFARRVVVNIDQCSDAIVAGASFRERLLHARARRFW
jgi:hypothetical protein